MTSEKWFKIRVLGKNKNAAPATRELGKTSGAPRKHPQSTQNACKKLTKSEETAIACTT